MGERLRFNQGRHYKSKQVGFGIVATIVNTWAAVIDSLAADNLSKGIIDLNSFLLLLLLLISI
jgi:hypothetical protein